MILILDLYVDSPNMMSVYTAKCMSRYNYWFVKFVLVDQHLQASNMGLCFTPYIDTNSQQPCVVSVRFPHL